MEVQISTHWFEPEFEPCLLAATRFDDDEDDVERRKRRVARVAFQPAGNDDMMKMVTTGFVFLSLRLMKRVCVREGGGREGETDEKKRQESVV